MAAQGTLHIGGRSKKNTKKTTLSIKSHHNQRIIVHLGQNEFDVGTGVGLCDSILQLLLHHREETTFGVAVVRQDHRHTFGVGLEDLMV